MNLKYRNVYELPEDMQCKCQVPCSHRKHFYGIEVFDSVTEAIESAGRSRKHLGIEICAEREPGVFGVVCFYPLIALLYRIP